VHVHFVCFFSAFVAAELQRLKRFRYPCFGKPPRLWLVRQRASQQLSPQRRQVCARKPAYLLSLCVSHYIRSFSIEPTESGSV
jgi:hypothetical protein